MISERFDIIRDPLDILGFDCFSSRFIKEFM